ncbi:hypothetical protein LCGC14_0442060 [marine sediment metagenome]|uniref:Sm domain-containing protein n=1 Tax=marine sediment metagenome TaxID=412755 RepID=A0A0F9V765_9ZZZZ
MVNISRPLDLLNSSKGKQVIVNLVGGSQMCGELIAFDIHVNIVLNNAREIVEGKQTTNYGQVFFRGDSVVFISPAD